MNVRGNFRSYSTLFLLESLWSVPRPLTVAKFKTHSEFGCPSENTPCDFPKMNDGQTTSGIYLLSSRARQAASHADDRSFNALFSRRESTPSNTSPTLGVHWDRDTVTFRCFSSVLSDCARWPSGSTFACPRRRSNGHGPRYVCHLNLQLRFTTNTDRDCVSKRWPTLPQTLVAKVRRMRRSACQPNATALMTGF